MNGPEIHANAIDTLLRGLPLHDSSGLVDLLTDIELPDGSGYSVVSRAKRKQPVKAVALARWNKAEEIRRSKEAGFDFHLTKPVDFFELRTVLDQVGSGARR